jgi:hypothetical protein
MPFTTLFFPLLPILLILIGTMPHHGCWAGLSAFGVRPSSQIVSSAQYRSFIMPKVFETRGGDDCVCPSVIDISNSINPPPASPVPALPVGGNQASNSVVVAATPAATGSSIYDGGAQKYQWQQQLGDYYGTSNNNVDVTANANNGYLQQQTPTSVLHIFLYIWHMITNIKYMSKKE